MSYTLNDNFSSIADQSRKAHKNDPSMPPAMATSPRLPPTKAPTPQVIRPAIRDPTKDSDPVIFYDPAILQSVHEFFGVIPPYQNGQVQHLTLSDEHFFEGRGTYDPRVDDLGIWRQKNENDSKSTTQSGPTGSQSSIHHGSEGRREGDLTSGLGLDSRAEHSKNRGPGKEGS